MSKSTPLAYAGIVGATFFWGTNFNAGAYIIKSMAPISASMERFAISTLLLVLIFGLAGKLRLSTLKNNLLAFIGLGLLGFTAFNLATFFGLQTTTPINGALILATTPLWTMIFAVLLEGERIDRGRAIGLVLGLLGVGLVITRGDIQVLLGLKVATGDAIILAGSIAWAANMVGTRRFVKDATPLETTTFSMLFGVIGLIVLGFIYEDPLANISTRFAVRSWSSHLPGGLRFIDCLLAVVQRYPCHWRCADVDLLQPGPGIHHAGFLDTGCAAQCLATAGRWRRHPWGGVCFGLAVQPEATCPYAQR